MPLYSTHNYSSECFVGPEGIIKDKRAIARRYGWAWTQEISRKIRWETSDVLPTVCVNRLFVLKHGVHNASPATWYQQQRAPSRDPGTGPCFVSSSIALATVDLFAVAILYRHSAAQKGLWVYYRITDAEIRTLFWQDLTDEEKDLLLRAIKKPFLAPFRGGIDYTRKAGRLTYRYPLENRAK